MFSRRERERERERLDGCSSIDKVAQWRLGGHGFYQECATAILVQQRTHDG